MVASDLAPSHAVTLSERERVISEAKRQARTAHDRCDEVDLQAGESDISESKYVYCGRCGQVLLHWGDADE